MSFSGQSTKKGQDAFVSRLYDLMDQCSRGNRSVMTSFLSLHEQETARNICSGYVLSFDGGYPEAEKKRLLISEVDLDLKPEVCCVRAEIPRFGKEITHPQVLGTLMHEGIKREALGDIVCTPDAVWIFCTPAIGRFICEQVPRIGSQMVNFFETEPDSMPAPERETIQINVPSMRTDAIVGALAHCSRAKAADLIRQGFVKVNDIVLEDNGRLCDNDVISVRRTGRFRFVGVVNKTRKDRLVLEFQKYK